MSENSKVQNGDKEVERSSEHSLIQRVGGKKRKGGFSVTR